MIAALEDCKLILGNKKTEAFKKSLNSTKLENITGEFEPEGNNKRTEVQYLGFHFNGENIILRPSTLSRHIRQKSKANYLMTAYKKTKDKRLAYQVNKIRRLIKKVENTNTD